MSGDEGSSGRGCGGKVFGTSGAVGGIVFGVPGISGVVGVGGDLLDLPGLQPPRPNATGAVRAS